MDNYKIKVNDEAESKEAQELFVKLGFEKTGFTCDEFPCYLATWEGGFSDYVLDSLSVSRERKELTIPQLRDLVVLKRNDVKDANCIDKKREAWYLASDGTYYAWQYRKLCWDTESDACVEAHDIKPINQPQAPALISGAEAKLAWANGVDIQIKNVNCVNWYDLDESKYNLDIFDNVRVDFRLKPQTIKLELELPKPFEPNKVGEKYYFIHLDNDNGYGFNYFESKKADACWMQFGAWRTEEEIKQVVEQLRKIRGTNS
ncbi:hypothetical protein MJ017_05325 [Acinetobacter baumannii]|nr:hypothetical protein [Acinetobacter baumannii]MCD0190618.1 hypothetical protein [Acinetobacter baumannii]MCF1254505.1 hypothetical protein [Acinetobacter baumannii]MDA3319792.1 hypothetical protein [Acinetobacter baumannii]MDA3435576.1 hypothetical protein [Acinetobacter baumannii]MDN8253054.1 hypothetical protein [Acinetobacter baumannii]